MFRLWLAAIVCFAQTELWAITEINVETAGTLSILNGKKFIMRQ